MSNCLNVSFVGVDSEALMLLLKDQFALSNGAACTSADYQSSYVLEAMGVSRELIDSAVRLSWGFDINEIDLSPIIGTIRAIQ